MERGNVQMLKTKQGAIMKFDEYIKINNLMFEYDELINNYCRKNQYSEEIINLAVNVADDIFDHHEYVNNINDLCDCVLTALNDSEYLSFKGIDNYDLCILIEIFTSIKM